MGCGGGGSRGGGCSDEDSDGATSIECGGLDCEEGNAAVGPGLDDLPGDGLDRNCDGIDGMDADGDHHGALGAGGQDCDDGDATRYPGAPDDENGVDENCDGVDGVDADGDGHATIATGGDDCDDTDPERGPQAEDTVGDEYDQNCDGADGVDADGDGHATVESGGDDCDDADPARFGVAEDAFGNGVDENCDGADGVDADGDGDASIASGGSDCDDADPLRGPSAADLVGDELDQNCDGADGVDLDGDLHATIASGGDDCDDADALRHPGAADDVGDGLDQNCDDLDGVDADGDGYASEASGGDDCDDALDFVHPGRPDGETAWEIVESTSLLMWSGLALDAAGAAHAGYSIADWEVRYATNESGAWEAETADDVGQPGWTTTFALDADGAAHIGYSEIGGTDLEYTTNASGAWDTQEVDTDGVTDAGIALDADGAPFFLYSFWVNGLEHGLRLASKTGADWEIEDVDVTRVFDGPNHHRAKLLVDPDGIVHGCAAIEQTEIRYYTNESGAWTWTRVTGTPGSTGDCAIARDDAGAIHVATAWGGGAKYSTNGTGAWVTTDVSPTDALYSSIGLDGDGAVHIAWQTWNLGSPDLMYATNMDGAWDAQAIATTGATGYAPSMAVETDGTAHLLHYDSTEGDILYGVVAPRNGVDDDCDGEVW